MLYVEKNILQIDTLEPREHVGVKLNPDTGYFERTKPQYEDVEVPKWEEPTFLRLKNPREPYFDDQYQLKPIPEEFWRYNSNFYDFYT